MDKNSLYYWDFVHYTPEGNNKIAQILSAELKKNLSENTIK
jgi:hypothetical protein